MNIRRHWFLKAFLLAALATLTFCLPPAQAAPPAPWLASVAYSGGMLGGEYLVINSVPTFIVYANGTAVWRDASKRSGGQGVDPAQWRVGTVSRDALKAFQAAVRANNFFDIQPQPVAPKVGPNGAMMGVMVSDGSTTSVAVQFGGQKRVVSEYALESAVQMGKDPVYVKAVTATRDAILALKPTQSQVCQPTSIKVGAFAVNDYNGAAVAWPLADTLTPAQSSQWRAYVGADAKAVIDALAENAYVKSGGVIYRAVWVPNIDTPAAEPVKPVENIRD